MQYLILKKLKYFLFLFFFYGSILSCFAQESIFTITFGEGTSPSSRKPLDPADGETTLEYAPTGNTSNGKYTLLPNPYYFYPEAYHFAEDHTPGDTNGYMMLLDIHSPNVSIYKKTIDDLCPNTKYKFSAWIANVTKDPLGYHYFSKSTFIIRDSRNNSVIATKTSPTILETPTLEWVQIFIDFTIPSSVSSIILEIVSGSDEFNHTAYDDITFEASSPKIQFTNFNTTICTGENVSMSCVVQPGFYTNPVYQWQKKNNSTAVWENIIGATNSNYTANNILETSAYRMLTAESGNIENSKCRTASAVNTVTVTPLNTVSPASASPSVCNNMLLTEITHTTTGATGIGTATGLPLGVTAKWEANKITISGTPTEAGTFDYIIPLKGGCGNIAATGTITVTAKPTNLITTKIICVGETYVWPANNVEYSTTQTGFKITNDGCTADQILNLTVTPKPADIVTTKTICSGQNYIWPANNVEYSTAQTGFKITNDGCTADQVLNLTVTPKPADIVTTKTICSGQTYIWPVNNVEYSTSQTGFKITNDGCTADQILNLTVTPKPADIVTTKTICSGQTYTWPANNVEYSTTQTGFKITNDGCTADQILNLTVTPKPADIVTTKTICSGQTYIWPANNVEYSTSQTGFKITNDGCTADQVLNLTVTSKPADIVTTKTICSGQTYTWPINNVEYAVSQSGLRISNDGCTADQILNLTVTPKPADIVTTKTICSGQTYIWSVNNVEYSTTQTGFKITNDGCTADQVLNLTVTTKPADVVTTKTICSGQTYIWLANNVQYSTAQTGFKIINDGCTANQVLNLTVTPKPEDIVNTETICSGETYTWLADGNIYNASGTYTINNDECTADQILKLTVGTKPDEFVNRQTICSGDNFTWLKTGKTYDKSGIYKVINDGCTPDYTLWLIVMPKPATPVITKTTSTCSLAEASTISNFDAHNIYTFNPVGPSIDSAGLISGMTIGTSYTVTADNGNCTSQESLPFENADKLSGNLIVTQIAFQTCVGTSFDNFIINKVTTGEVTGIGTPINLPPGLTAVWSSSDKTIKINGTVTGVSNLWYRIPLITEVCGIHEAIGQIVVIPKPATIVTEKTICKGDKYKWEINNKEYTTEGIYTIKNDVCTADQVLDLKVDIPNNQAIKFPETICVGETIFLVPSYEDLLTSSDDTVAKTYSGTVTAIKPGTATITYKSKIGVCPETSFTGIINVVAKPAKISTTETICSGENLHWTANNTDYDTAGTYTIINDLCTADEELILNVTPKPADIVTKKTICSGQTYTWPSNNVEYSTTQTGFKITNDGCTADQILNLTVTPKPADIVTTKTICSGQTYIWSANNVEYSTVQSGFKITNDGCTADQVLNLTVTPKPADIVTTKTICSGQTYTWPVNNVEYSTTQTGFKITNDGCTADQVLNLTVTTKPTDIVTTKTICSGQTYTWPINNVEYAVSQSGLRISNDGCTADQVLNLTVTTKPADVVTTKTICSGQTYTWPVNNVEYSTTQTGFKITNDGCTADQVLNLTVTPKPADIVTTKTICSGQTYIWPANNVEYTVSQSGLKISNDGCTADQVLNLTVTPKPADIVTTKTICSGQTYIWPVNNVEYSTSQTGFKITNDGCTADQILNLTVTPKPADIIMTKTICSGQTYIWPANNVEYDVSQSGLKISNDGCTADQVLNLTVTPKPTDVVTTKTICSGQTYIWPVNNVEYVVSQSGLRISNDGCTADQILNLTVAAKPAKSSITQTICSGETFHWTADDTDYNTAGTYTVIHNGCTADEELILNVTPKPAKIVTEKTICAGETFYWMADNTDYNNAGTYTVIHNGCNADEELKLTVNKISATYTQTNAKCKGESNGSVIINPHGGTGIYTITPSQIGLSAGTHSFTITDSNNCFTTIDIVISEPNQLQASIVGPINPEYCTGENNGSFSMEISGGTKPYHYSLDQEAGIFSDGSSDQSLFDIENISAGQHSVYVKDAQGCTTQLQVNLPAAVVINPIVAITRFCQGNTIGNAVTVTIDSSVNPADVDYALDEGIYQSSNIFTNLSPGEHTIKARHSNGCLQSTAVFIIDEVKPLKLTLANGELNEIVATASEGGVNYQYSFDDEPFSSNNKLIIYKSGNYTVTVKDSNGCSITLSKYFDYIDVCIPNYFTPNGDGVNDDWGPDCSVNYKNLTFTILDRYGREIAKYHYGQKWDGKYNGQELTSGDYWYVIKLNDPKDNREFVGHFTLYR